MNMKEYVISLISLSLFAAAILALAPKSQERHIRLLCALCLICVMVSPVIGFIESVKGIDLGALTDGVKLENDYENMFVEGLSRLSADQLETELTRLVASEFDIKESELHFSVGYKTVDGAMQVERIDLRLSGAALLKDPYKIESYLARRTGVTCSVR